MHSCKGQETILISSSRRQSPIAQLSDQLMAYQQEEESHHR